MNPMVFNILKNEVNGKKCVNTISVMIELLI